jgi:hypothetical protein
VPKSETQFVVVPSESRMALKRRLQDKHIAQELILDSDTHISEDDISPQSDSDTEEDDRKIQAAKTGPTLHDLDLLHQ